MLNFKRNCDYNQDDEMEYGVYQIEQTGEVLFNLGVYERSLGDYTPSVSLNKESLRTFINQLEGLLKIMEEYEKRVEDEINN